MLHLDDWEKRQLQIDCYNGNALNPNFFHCKECPCTKQCEIFNSLAFEVTQEVYYQNLRAESLENRATYFHDDYCWFDANYNIYGWEKVKKNKELRDIGSYKFCLSGDATHPRFWDCENCNIKDTCELGAVRLRKNAELYERRHELKWQDKVKVENKYLRKHGAEIRAAKLQRTKENVKNFFGKISDTFDRFFR